MIIENSDPAVLIQAVLVHGNQPDSSRVELRTRGMRQLLPFVGPHPMGEADDLTVEAGYACVGICYPQGATTPNYKLLTFVPNQELSYIDCIPDDACAIPGLVERFRALRDSISNEALRDFLDRVFSLPEVFLYYWTCPGSRSHHHNHPGGGALHSVTVAEKIQHSNLETAQCELGIVMALIHDIGKIWAYEGEYMSDEASQLGHDTIGLIRVFPFLEKLIEDWPEGGRGLLGMLCRSCVGGEFPKVPPVYRVVRAFDFYDADHDLAKRGDRRCKGVWPSNRDRPPTAKDASGDELF